MTKKINNALEFLPSILVALALFFYLTGGKILNVNYYQWLNSLDPSQFFLGWLFFKNSDFWQNIIGFNPDFGYEITSSIVYTDSIPLLAILFKIFAKFLPQNFQYFGLWILSCLVLQAIFAMILLKKITPNFATQFIGSLFFILSPILIFRIFYCHHFSLGGHFLILAALILYFSKDFLQTRWILLLLVAVGVHFYIFFMIFLVYLADVMQRAIFLRPNLDSTKLFSKAVFANINQAAERIFIAIIFILLAMWQYGYFVVGVQNASSPLFGETKMNLLSIIDSDALWSKIIPNQLQGNFEYEGFAFLGLGIILMIATIFIVELFYRKNLVFFNNKLREKRFLPLIFIAILLTLIALSNRISIGSTLLIEFKISDSAHALLGIIRSSGRMFWVVYYLIIIGAIYAIIKLFKDKANLALTLFFILQFWDMSNGLKQAKAEMKSVYKNENFFTLPQSNFWEIAKNKYQKIIFIPVSNDPQKYEPIAYFAATNHLKINSGHVSRYNKSAQEAANNQHVAEISSGIFDKNALYIFNDEKLWQLAKQSSANSAFIAQIGDYKIIAPEEDLRK